MVSVRHAHGEALSIPVRPRMGAPARSSASKALNYHTRQRIRASRTTQAHCVKDCTLASGVGLLNQTATTDIACASQNLASLGQGPNIAKLPDLLRGD